MAICRFSVTNSTTHNTSASSHADYIKREGKYSPEYQKENEIVLPKSYEDLIYKEDFNMPEFGKENSTLFWTASEQFERSNGRTYTQFEISLPHEINDEDNIKLIKEFSNEIFTNKFPYTLAVHKKPSSKKDTDNIHAHIMFCERELDGIERNPIQFFKRANLKNPELGGTKKNRQWHDINMPKIYRVKWANFINKDLEKRGIELISPETLKKQREEYLRKGDQLKADLLDREVININGYILMKLEKGGINSLTSWEQEELEHFKKVKEFKALKEELYKVKLEQEQTTVLDFSNENNKAEFKQNEYIELEVTINHCKNFITKSKENLIPANLEILTLNTLTNNKYGEISKFLKDYDFSYNLQTKIGSKILDYREQYKNIRNKYLPNNNPTMEYLKAMDSIIADNNNVIATNSEKLAQIEKFRNDNIDIFEKKISVDTLNQFQEKVFDNKENLLLKKTYYSNAKIALEKELSNIDIYALNKATKGEYLKTLNEKQRGYNSYEKLTELKEKTSSFNLIEKLKINNKLRELYNNEQKLISKLDYMKNNTDYSKEKMQLENTLNNGIKKIMEKENNINNQILFEKDKLDVIQEKLLYFHNKEFKSIKENTYKIKIADKTYNADSLNIFKQKEIIELTGTLNHCEKTLERAIENLIPEKLERIVLNSLTNNLYQDKLNLVKELEKQTETKENKEKIYKIKTEIWNIQDTYLPNKIPCEEYLKAKNSILEKYDKIIKYNTEKIEIIKTLQEQNKQFFESKLDIKILEELKKETTISKEQLEKQKELNIKLKNRFKDNLVNLEEYALNKAAHGNYFKTLKEQQNIQKELNEFEKNKKFGSHNKISVLSEKNEVLLSKINNMKKDIDYSKELAQLEKIFNKNVNKYANKEREINNQILFEKDKLVVLEEKILSLNHQEKNNKEDLKIFIDINNQIDENNMLNILKQEALKEENEYRIKSLKETLNDREAMEAKVLDKLTNGEYTKNYNEYTAKNTELHRIEILKEYFENFEKGNLKTLVDKKVNDLQKYYSSEIMKLELSQKEIKKYDYDIEKIAKLDKDHKNKLCKSLDEKLTKDIKTLEIKLSDLNKKINKSEDVKEKILLGQELKETKKTLKLTTNTLWKNRTVLRGDKKPIINKSNTNIRKPKKYTAGLRITDHDIFAKKENLSDKWNRQDKGMER